MSVPTPMPTAVQLIAEHRNVELLLLPTGSILFERGESVSALYAIERGLVELTTGGRDRLRYGDGEVFFYEDLVVDDAHHSRTARAITPVHVLRLDRNSFLELIHRHPTLVLSLLSGQHRRLREQRLGAAHFY
ncbi:cyclic nucleotide-binding domain-containing protein [Synechococcus sp. MIT S9508]|uniref:cyclic nucleotide-binding domain-containing protein n=2 Tax=unclassified Synechococcus TaxID=2626047 RepID=UPI001E4AC180|nr:cyclic nucleotide-binding domain-containing protein [Synechococcus sp. MIT S9508]